MLPVNLSKVTKTKCGEIFCHNYNFIIDCHFCALQSFAFEDFLVHLKIVHFKDKLLKAETINTDCNQFLEVTVKNEVITEETHSWDGCGQQSFNDCANDFSSDSYHKDTITIEKTSMEIVNDQEGNKDNGLECDNSKSQMDFNSQYRYKDDNRNEEYATKRDVQQIKDKLESNTMVLKLLLDEMKSLHNIELPNTLKTTTVLPNNPFHYKEEFINFESSLQASEEMFLVMVKELKVKASGNSTKFIRNSWRLLMNDEAAKEFCWQGSQSKMALKQLTTTRAIKHAYTDKFLDHSDPEFEKITIMHFQQAKNRCDKKYKKNS